MRIFSAAGLLATVLAAPLLAVPLLAVPTTTAKAETADITTTGWQPLVSPAELSTLLESGEVRVVDIRGGRTEDGVPVFNAGHIPGAVSAPYGRWRGPEDNPGKLPALDDLGALVRSLGLDETASVVVAHTGTNATDFGSAARVYWTLKSIGIPRVAVLNGGVDAWRAAGLPLTAEAAKVSPSSFSPVFNESWHAGRDDVLRMIEEGGRAELLDARPSEFFLGRLWHAAARRPGTLPDARNLTHDVWFVDGGPVLRTPEEIVRIAREHGLEDGATTVSFCNTGHWAATNWFVLSEVVGLEDVKLYPESMVGWSADGLPMANAPGRLEWLWMSTKKWFDGLRG